MSYAGEVARGISESAEHTAMTTRAVSETAPFIERSIAYQLKAETFEYSDWLLYHSGQVDTWNAQVRSARRENTKKKNKIVTVPIRRLDW